MAYYEKKAKRNGVPLAVQYLLLERSVAPHDIRLHYHEYIELLCGVSGSARVVFGDRELILPAGAMVVIHANEPHDVLPHEAPCCYHVVKFLPEILLAGEQSFAEYGYVLMLTEQTSAKQVFFDASELSGTGVPELFGRMREEWNRQEFGYELSLRADVTRIFLFILRKWLEKDPTLKENVQIVGRSELIRNAIGFIRRNYCDATEQKTADHCGVSPAYLSRLFKKKMNVSFSDYIISLRLREAERLLLTTDASVTEIAQTVGFGTSAYFISLFRSRKGITPYRYRLQTEKRT